MTPRAALLADAPARPSTVTDPRLWRNDVYLAPIADLLPSLRVLSVDVFDTLLFRACRRPEDIFMHVGERASARGLLRHGLGPADFAALREAAQESCYRGLGREPRLEDIYAAMPASIGPTRELLRLEEDVERERCWLNPSVASLIEACAARGIRVVLLSDMYLGEARIRSMLAAAGFDVDRAIDRVIVSVDHGGYKSDGRLFAHLRDLYPDAAPDSILHLGDNTNSDVHAARAAGLRAIHYAVVHDDPTGVHALEELVCGNLLPELQALRHLGGSLAAALPPSDQPWFRIGATVVGPFLSALIDWTLDVCAVEGITQIAPLMREAHLLVPMLRRAAAARRMTIDIAPLFVSRHAVRMTGIADLERDLVPALLNDRREMTLADVLALIEIDVPAPLAHLAAQPVQSLDGRTIDGQPFRHVLSAHLTSDSLAPRIARVLADARGRLVDYADSVFGEHRAVATLDIGFFGTIQHNLGTALRLAGRHRSLTHLLAFGHGPIRDHLLAGLDFRVFAAGAGDCRQLVKTLHRSAPVIEQLAQGDAGTTIGYARAADGSCRPVQQVNPLSSEERRRKSIVRKGIRASHELWLALRDARPVVVADTVARRDAWCRLIHRLVDVPTATEAWHLGELHDDINFGSRAVMPLCPEGLDVQVAWDTPSLAYDRGSAALPAVWPQGVITRADPGAIAARYADASPRPFFGLAFALARMLRAQDLTRVVGYGTGEIADVFVDACSILGIELAALVDSNPSRHGNRLRGVPIVGLEDAMALAPPAVAILSLANALAIAAVVRARCAGRSRQPLIVDLTTVRPTRH